MQDEYVCPGMMTKQLREKGRRVKYAQMNVLSQLGHWPVQLRLVSPNAPNFADVGLLLVADCVPFAMGDFHSKFRKYHSVVVECPKLDDAKFHIDKLAVITQANKLNSLTVIYMELP
jgi:hypothetical protein